MRYLKCTITAIALVLSTNVNAALIDNGNYTTDDVNQLDWLDLSYTEGVSYTDATSVADTVEGGGWTYATDAQVTSMWGQIFSSDWIPTASGNITSTAYTEEVDTFTEMFGVLENHPDYSGTLGWFRDDASILRLMGVVNYLDPDAPDEMLGPDYTANFNSVQGGVGNAGTYLVRTSVVPVPAAAWLFGSGLLGLIGVARRKARA